MRKLIGIFTVLAFLGMPIVSQGVDFKLTMDNKTVTPGSTVAVNVL